LGVPAQRLTITMNNSIVRPILFEYFKSTAEVLQAEYDRSKQQNAAANLGR